MADSGMSSAPSMHRLPMLRSCSALQMSSSRCLSKPSARALLRMSKAPGPGGSQMCSLCVCTATSFRCSEARRHADWHALSWDLHVCGIQALMGEHFAQDKLQPGVVISRRICVRVAAHLASSASAGEPHESGCAEASLHRSTGAAAFGSSTVHVPACSQSCSLCSHQSTSEV